jgi:HSP20 family protein
VTSWYTDDMANRWRLALAEAAASSWRYKGHPESNIYQGDNGWGLELNIPGVIPSDLDISMDGRVLTIKGSYERVDSSIRTFERLFELPHEVSADSISARCKDGVLWIMLPKQKSDNARRVKIEVA